MNDILVEFDKYISSNKDVLSVLPVNNKRNRTKYVEKVQEFEDTALQIRKVIWNEIQYRYEKILDIKEDPKIGELEKAIEEIKNIEVFNELNTPFEKLGLDKITHSLSCFFEGDLNLVNNNIKLFIEKFEEFGIELSKEDFNYSPYTMEYIGVFLEETENGKLNSDRLKKTFEKIYWQCPDIVMHIELNMRYLYYINSKRIEKELNDRNSRILTSMNLDKNGLVSRFFELNKDLIKAKRKDAKAILDKFINDEWKIKDFSEKDMSVVYDRLSSKKYFAASPEEQEEIDKNFGKLLNTLQEYSTYVKYKYIIDDLKKKYKNKESFKDSYEKKNKELRKKEAELLKENKKHQAMIKQSKNPLFIFFKKKLDRKIYEFPVSSNTQIKELQKMYMELDEEAVNLRIAEFVDDNCTIKYMFKIAVSFYTYAYKLVKEHYKDDMGIDITEELQGLIDFINQPYKVMLNNIKLAEEPDITSIISNRYKILNINLEKENLEPESIDSLIEDVEKIANYYNLKRSGLSFDDIAFVEKVKPLIAKNNKD